MAWITLSLLTALMVSSHDAWVKKFFSHLSAFDMLAYPLAYSCPMFTAAALLAPMPPLDATFYINFALCLPINGLSLLFYMKAIKISPLSLTIPYLAFSPVFIIGTGFVFLGEMPDFWGVAGIVVTCLGSYILNIDPKSRSFLAPFKAVFKEPGSWIMLIVSLLFAFSAVIGKKAMLHSSPVFFTMSFFAVHNFVIVVLLLALGTVKTGNLREAPMKGAAAGLLLFFHALFHGWAVVLTKTAYMISMKRLSVLFSIIYGGLLFKEDNLLIRFTGAAFMVMGAVMISLKGG